MNDDVFLFQFGNIFKMALDRQENLYVAYFNRNLIEKYSLDGKLLMQISRKNGVDETNSFTTFPIRRASRDPETGELFNIRWEDRQIMNRITDGIETDHQGRIWVLSHFKNRFQRTEEPGPNDASKINLWRFEIYNPDGVLIGRLPVPQEKFEKMRIFGSTMFLIDTNKDMLIYEYEIVDL